MAVKELPFEAAAALHNGLLGEEPTASIDQRGGAAWRAILLNDYDGRLDSRPRAVNRRVRNIWHIDVAGAAAEAASARNDRDNGFGDEPVRVLN